SRFLRLAERRVAEKGGRGVVCFISSFSYISDPSFVVLRKRFMDEFDSIWIDCLNGDSRETGKQTPDGGPDPSVFSTEWNKAGIQLGTAVGLFVKRGKTHAEREGITVADKKVRFRHFWGQSKRKDLLASLDDDDFEAQYDTSNPRKENRWSFRPSDVTSEYLAWPKATELCALPPYNGPVERRGFALISIAKDPLAGRISSYFDVTVSDDEIRNIHLSLMMTGNRIVGPEARRKVLSEFQYDESRIVRYPFKPFDVRWCYLENLRPLFSEPSPQLLNQRFPGNSFFITRDTADKDPEGPPFLFSPVVCDYDFISGHARHFPLHLKVGPSLSTGYHAHGNHALPGMEPEAEQITANLSPAARAYLGSLGLPDPDTEQTTAEMIWYHALAIGYSPAYLAENADGIRQDWPRIPLPQAKDLLLASAALGRQVAALLDTEAPVTGVTAGKIRDELKHVAVFQRVDGKPANPD
ncbi:MAG: DNA methyltransferase, partial [Syntrophus sp. (in: bacteria)]|nr:DNA methyltransferase [Syntrophus sp. (in: bacteria)]